MSKTMKNEPVTGSSLMTPNGFDIVSTIGHVEFSALGEMSAVEAAMSLIGKHHAPGSYRFPHEDGGEWVVEMSHDPLMQEVPPHWEDS